MMSDISDDVSWYESDEYEPMWGRGYHVTKDGKEIPLSHMSKEHLINTIIHFKKYDDVSVLEKELELREAVDKR